MAWEVLAAPILVALGGLATWFVQSRVEEVRGVEEKLRADRRKVYADILDPYIRIFAAVKDTSAQGRAVKDILSFNYRKTAFELGLVGSDNVVRAYNRMMQHYFHAKTGDVGHSAQGMLLWGALLLEIRKSLGNNRTKLEPADMLRGMVTDIDQFIAAARPIESSQERVDDEEPAGPAS